MPTAAIIAIVIAIPVILFPAAFIWFINVTGLWTVWKESRARQRRRVEARKEALVKVIK
jgi:predicted membrane protein